VSYQQVRDVLSLSERLRENTLRLVRRHRGEGNDELLDSLAERVCAHDDAVADVLRRYADSSDEGVLNAWVQFTDLSQLEQDFREELGETRVDAGGSVAEAAERLLALDERLLELYRLAAAQMTAPRARELFERLATLEDQSLRDKGWANVQAEDLRETPADSSSR